MNNQTQLTPAPEAKADKLPCVCHLKFKKCSGNCDARYKAPELVLFNEITDGVKQCQGLQEENEAYWTTRNVVNSKIALMIINEPFHRLPIDKFVPLLLIVYTFAPFWFRKLISRLRKEYPGFAETKERHPIVTDNHARSFEHLVTEIPHVQTFTVSPGYSMEIGGAMLTGDTMEKLVRWCKVRDLRFNFEIKANHLIFRVKP